MKATTTDLLQAWGTIAGAIFAAGAAVAAFLVLVHEIRVRRRNENDIRASTARSVLVTTGDVKGKQPKDGMDGLITPAEFFVSNFSRFPVIDLLVSVKCLGRKGHYAWGTDLLKPGESKVVFEWEFDPPLRWPYHIFPPSLFHVSTTFTDDNGLRWERIDRQQPSRMAG
jgi:hypothetical protein